MTGLEFNPESATLLYFKVGVLGSVPLDFCQAVASTYDAHYFSSGQLRDAIRGERIRAGNPRRVSTEDMRKRLVDEAGPLLKDEQDVVADFFINNPNTRSLGPAQLAKKTGALAVALNIITPVERVEERVERWLQEATIGSPSKEWERNPFSIMRQMFDSVVRPREDEELGFVINVDGSSDNVSDLVDQVGVELDRRGLLEDY